MALCTGLALGVIAPPARQPLHVSLISLTSVAYAGEDATLIARTAPGSSCTIAVFDKPGRSRDRRLVVKTADIQGIVMWTWQVGTTPGTYPILVTCTADGSQGKLEASLVVEPSAGTTGSLAERGELRPARTL